MRTALQTALGIGITLMLGCSGPQSATAQDPTPGYEIVATFPHDSDAFTQGLDFWRGRFFESTGLEGESTVREVDLETGEVERSVSIADRFFGEGMTIRRGRLYQLTWQSKRAFVYEPETFERTGRFRYREEGWGLTNNRRWLIMSNGTDVITFRRPRNFRPVRRIHVTDDGEPVEDLNELEWIQGEIFANVFPTDEVVRIDPKTGEVVGRLDLSRLKNLEEAQGEPEATNGIAYLPGEERVFVTGKYWAHVYEIRPTD